MLFFQIVAELFKFEDDALVLATPGSRQDLLKLIIFLNHQKTLNYIVIITFGSLNKKA